MKLTQPMTQLRGAQRAAAAVGCVVFGLAVCTSALALRVDVAQPGTQPMTPTAVLSPGASPQEPAHPARISGGVMAGNSLTKVPPVYPPDAKAAGIQGAVVLHALIGKDGNVENLTVVSGQEDLARAAIDAVMQWTYRPYLLNGEPTEVDTTITVNFQLQNRT